MTLSKNIIIASICLFLSSFAYANNPGGTIPADHLLDLQFDNIYGKTQITCAIQTASAQDELIHIQACGPACFSSIESTMNGTPIGSLGAGTNAQIKGNNYANTLTVTLTLALGFAVMHNTNLSFRKFSDGLVNVTNCVATPLAG